MIGPGIGSLVWRDCVIGQGPETLLLLVLELFCFCLFQCFIVQGGPLWRELHASGCTCLENVESTMITFRQSFHNFPS